MNKKLFKKLNEAIDVSSIEKKIIITESDEQELIFGNGLEVCDFVENISEDTKPTTYADYYGKMYLTGRDARIKAREDRYYADLRAKEEKYNADLAHAHGEKQKDYDEDIYNLINNAKSKLRAEMHKLEKLYDAAKAQDAKAKDTINCIKVANAVIDKYVTKPLEKLNSDEKYKRQGLVLKSETEILATLSSGGFDLTKYLLRGK